MSIKFTPNRSIGGTAMLTVVKGEKGDTGDTGNTGATGATGPGYAASSTTSNSIASSGSKSFTVAAALAYTVGARVRASDSSNPNTNWMEGVVTAYSGTTLTFTADLSAGAGTLTSWNINLAGERGATGAQGPQGDPGTMGGTLGSTDNVVPRTDGTGGTTLQAGLFTNDDSGNIFPNTNDVGALGKSGTAWADLFLATGGVANWNAGNITITHSSNLLAFGGSAPTFSFGGKVYPASDDGAALGDTTHNWSDLFLASGAVINFANGNATLTHSSGLVTWSVPVSLGISNAFTCGSIELGHASANTLTASGGNLSIEGNQVYRASGTDVAIADGGTGQSTAPLALNALITGSSQKTTLAPTDDKIGIADNAGATGKYATVAQVATLARGVPGNPSSRYITSETQQPSSTQTLAMSANTLYAMPFFVGAKYTWTGESINVTATGTATNARLGIFDATGTGGLPGVLVLDAGAVSVGGTGIKTASISQSLEVGYYWLVVVADGSVTITAGNSQSSGTSIIGSIALGATGDYTVNKSFTYGVLSGASPFGAPTYTSGNNYPTIALSK